MDTGVNVEITRSQDKLGIYTHSQPYQTYGVVDRRFEKEDSFHYQMRCELYKYCAQIIDRSFEKEVQIITESAVEYLKQFCEEMLISFKYNYMLPTCLMLANPLSQTSDSICKEMSKYCSQSLKGSFLIINPFDSLDVINEYINDPKESQLPLIVYIKNAESRDKQHLERYIDQLLLLRLEKHIPTILLLSWSFFPVRIFSLINQEYTSKMIIKPYKLPSPIQLLDRLFDTLIINNPLPITIPMTLLENMTSKTLADDFSVMRWIKDLKYIIYTYISSQRLSFLCLYALDTFKNMNAENTSYNFEKMNAIQGIEEEHSLEHEHQQVDNDGTPIEEDIPSNVDNNIHTNDDDHDTKDNDDNNTKDNNNNNDNSNDDDNNRDNVLDMDYIEEDDHSINSNTEEDNEKINDSVSKNLAILRQQIKKRKTGRPRKHPVKEQIEYNGPKRARGRPRGSKSINHNDRFHLETFDEIIDHKERRRKYNKMNEDDNMELKIQNMFDLNLGFLKLNEIDLDYLIDIHSFKEFLSSYIPLHREEIYYMDIDLKKVTKSTTVLNQNPSQYPLIEIDVNREIDFPESEEPKINTQADVIGAHGYLTRKCKSRIEALKRKEQQALKKLISTKWSNKPSTLKKHTKKVSIQDDLTKNPETYEDVDIGTLIGSKRKISSNTQSRKRVHRNDNKENNTEDDKEINIESDTNNNTTTTAINDNNTTTTNDNNNTNSNNINNNIEGTLAGSSDNDDFYSNEHDSAYVSENNKPSIQNQHKNTSDIEDKNIVSTNKDITKDEDKLHSTMITGSSLSSAGESSNLSNTQSTSKNSKQTPEVIKKLLVTRSGSRLVTVANISLPEAPVLIQKNVGGRPRKNKCIYTDDDRDDIQLNNGLIIQYQKQLDEEKKDLEESAISKRDTSLYEYIKFKIPVWIPEYCLFYKVKQYIFVLYKHFVSLLESNYSDKDIFFDLYAENQGEIYKGIITVIYKLSLYDLSTFLDTLISTINEGPYKKHLSTLQDQFCTIKKDILTCSLQESSSIPLKENSELKESSLVPDKSHLLPSTLSGRTRSKKILLNANIKNFKKSNSSVDFVTKQKCIDSLNYMLYTYVHPVYSHPLQDIFTITNNSTIKYIKKTLNSNNKGYILSNIREQEKWINCACCTPLVLSSSNEDISICYEYYLNCSRYINLNEWYTSFESYFKTRNSKLGHRFKEDEIKDRFLDSVTTLQYLGFINQSATNNQVYIKQDFSTDLDLKK